jgi:hypothetical protein
MLQSKAGIENREYKAQRALLAEVDAGRISKDELFAHAEELLKARMGGRPAPHKPAEPAVPRSAGAPGADTSHRPERPEVAGASAPMSS